jgi:hypothetical protein
VSCIALEATALLFLLSKETTGGFFFVMEISRPGIELFSRYTTRQLGSPDADT